MSDRPIDGTMRRREMVALSAGGLASLAIQACGGGGEAGPGPGAAAVTPDCVLTPEQEEGPFYIDLARVRRNLVEDRPGVPLTLALTVVDAQTCSPIRDAAVDIWHCDALGTYSGEPSEGSKGSSYLRGIQLTDGNGLAEFETIYPGQYPGRTTHIHLKVRTGGRAEGGAYSGGDVSHTGQLFVSDRRDADAIFATQGGSSAVLALAPAGNSLRSDGLAGRATLGVQSSV